MTQLLTRTQARLAACRFEAWKDSKADPAPIAKTLSPITELMVQFAEMQEQCEKKSEQALPPSADG